MDIKIEETDNYKPVERLYKLVYPGKSARKFAWLYTTNPSGSADIFLVREPKKKTVIATYVIMPMRIWYHDRIIKIGQAIDGMVHPDFRKQRIFNTIQQNLHERLREKYEFLIGFPNRLALNPLLKAGATDFGPLATYSFPLTSQFLAKRPGQGNIFYDILSLLLKPALALHKKFYLGGIKTDGCRLEQPEKDSIHFDIEYPTIRKAHPIMTVRDKEFIAWRFFSVPSGKYIFLHYAKGDDVIGYIGIRFEHKAVAIVDFCIDGDIDDQLRALKLLVRYCEQRRVKSIHFQLSEACYCAGALRRAGFIKRQNNYSIIIFPYSDDSKQLQYSDFFLTFADTDWI